MINGFSWPEKKIMASSFNALCGYGKILTFTVLHPYILHTKQAQFNSQTICCQAVILKNPKWAIGESVSPLINVNYM